VRTNEATEKQWHAMGSQKQQALLESVALRRLGTAEEIANTCLSLPMFPGMTDEEITYVSSHIQQFLHG
jgi:dTDP-4-amino-4,6-dideoxygalactose transaminase